MTSRGRITKFGEKSSVWENRQNEQWDKMEYRGVSHEHRGIEKN